MSKNVSGFKFLSRAGVIEQLISALSDSNIDETLKCGVIKFWGFSLYYQAENLASFHNFNQIQVYDCLEYLLDYDSSSTSIMNACILAVANIGSSLQGLAAIYDHNRLISKFFDVHAKLTSSSDSKAMGFNAICCLLNHEISSDIDVNSITHQLFLKICIT